MCGIFGIFAIPNSSLSSVSSFKIIKELSELSQSRGMDSSGLVLINDSKKEIDISKGAIPIKNLIKDLKFKDKFKNYFNNIIKSKSNFCAFGHSRLVTNGTQLNNENNQPIIKDKIIGVHNGIIVNNEKLWKENPDIKRNYEIDTEVLLSLISNKMNSANFLKSIIDTVQNDILGTVSTALFISDINKMVLTTNNGSLYLIKSIKSDSIIFASEERILKKLLNNNSDLKSNYDFNSIIPLPPNTGFLLDIVTFESNFFEYSKSLSNISDIKKTNYNIVVDDFIDKSEERSIIINPSIYQSNSLYAEESSLLEFNIDSIKELPRCNKCILPVTFPNISFDSENICNFCRNYIPKNDFKPFEELQKLVKPYRKANGKQDIIIPLSGGRDSVFMLHKIKKDLEMNPLTFTYDWGMVTDLARRNIARICGKLGVENIIVAANIKRKRSNVKKNLKAWLHNPHLGIITLLMAGDKYFFSHCEKLKKDTGINLNIWGENHLENTDFKSGFIGIKPLFKKKFNYSLRYKDQVKLFSFITKQLVNNPKYINNSMPDTLGSFFVRYFYPKKDYFRFYDYYRWNEKEIEDLIMEEYDWETSIDTPSTWRIGDGTASFYNYVYYNVAGFSEVDTFRSNQIREGMISRSSAIELSQKENLPRFETIKWYLEILGLDFSNVIKRINKIPKLYKIKS